MSSPTSALPRRRHRRRALSFAHSQASLSDLTAAVDNAVSVLNASPRNAADLRTLRDTLRMAATIAQSIYASQLGIEKGKQRIVDMLASVEICHLLLSGKTPREIGKLKGISVQHVGIRSRSVALILGERLHRAGLLSRPRLHTLPFSAVRLMSSSDHTFLSSALNRLHTEHLALLAGTPADRAFLDAWTPGRETSVSQIA